MCSALYKAKDVLHSVTKFKHKSLRIENLPSNFLTNIHKRNTSNESHTNTITSSDHSYVSKKVSKNKNKKGKVPVKNVGDHVKVYTEVFFEKSDDLNKNTQKNEPKDSNESIYYAKKLIQKSLLPQDVRPIVVAIDAGLILENQVLNQNKYVVADLLKDPNLTNEILSTINCNENSTVDEYKSHGKKDDKGFANDEIRSANEDNKKVTHLLTNKVKHTKLSPDELALPNGEQRTKNKLKGEKYDLKNPVDIKTPRLNIYKRYNKTDPKVSDSEKRTGNDISDDIYFCDLPETNREMKINQNEVLFGALENSKRIIYKNNIDVKDTNENRSNIDKEIQKYQITDNEPERDEILAHKLFNNYQLVKNLVIDKTRLRDLYDRDGTSSLLVQHNSATENQLLFMESRKYLSTATSESVKMPFYRGISKPILRSILLSILESDENKKRFSTENSEKKTDLNEHKILHMKPDNALSVAEQQPSELKSLNEEKTRNLMKLGKNTLLNQKRENFGNNIIFKFNKTLEHKNKINSESGCNTNCNKYFSNKNEILKKPQVIRGKRDMTSDKKPDEMTQNQQNFLNEEISQSMESNTFSEFISDENNIPLNLISSLNKSDRDILEISQWRNNLKEKLANSFISKKEVNSNWYASSKRYQLNYPKQRDSDHENLKDYSKDLNNENSVEENVLLTGIRSVPNNSISINSCVYPDRGFQNNRKYYRNSLKLDEVEAYLKKKQYVYKYTSEKNLVLDDKTRENHTKNIRRTLFTKSDVSNLKPLKNEKKNNSDLVKAISPKTANISSSIKTRDSSSIPNHKTDKKHDKIKKEIKTKQKRLFKKQKKEKKTLDIKLSEYLNEVKKRVVFGGPINKCDIDNEKVFKKYFSTDVSREGDLKEEENGILMLVPVKPPNIDKDQELKDVVEKKKNDVNIPKVIEETTLDLESKSQTNSRNNPDSLKEGTFTVENKNHHNDNKTTTHSNKFTRNNKTKTKIYVNSLATNETLNSINFAEKIKSQKIGHEKQTNTRPKKFINKKEIIENNTIIDYRKNRIFNSNYKEHDEKYNDIMNINVSFLADKYKNDQIKAPETISKRRKNISKKNITTLKNNLKDDYENISWNKEEIYNPSVKNRTKDLTERLRTIRNDIIDTIRNVDQRRSKLHKLDENVATNNKFLDNKILSINDTNPSKHYHNKLKYPEIPAEQNLNSPNSVKHSTKISLSPQQKLSIADRREKQIFEPSAVEFYTMNHNSQQKREMLESSNLNKLIWMRYRENYIKSSSLNKKEISYAKIRKLQIKPDINLKKDSISATNTNDLIEKNFNRSKSLYTLTSDVASTNKMQIKGGPYKKQHEGAYDRFRNKYNYRDHQSDKSDLIRKQIPGEKSLSNYNNNKKPMLNSTFKYYKPRDFINKMKSPIVDWQRKFPKQPIHPNTKTSEREATRIMKPAPERSSNSNEKHDPVLPSSYTDTITATQKLKIKHGNKEKPIVNFRNANKITKIPTYRTPINPVEYSTKRDENKFTVGKKVYVNCLHNAQRNTTDDMKNNHRRAHVTKNHYNDISTDVIDNYNNDNSLYSCLHQRNMFESNAFTPKPTTHINQFSKSWKSYISNNVMDCDVLYELPKRAYINNLNQYDVFNLISKRKVSKE